MPAVLRTRTRTDYNDDQAQESKTKTRRRRNSDDEDEPVPSANNKVVTFNKLVAGRPFELVSELPSSLEIPEYGSALTQPLAVKDSGVLYHSLITSRNTWIHGEMFDLYWVKPTKAVGTVQSEANFSMARDKMQKMSDCNMYAGPHVFPIRIFILKDDKVEERFQQELDDKKKKKELKKKMDIEAKQKKTEERKQKQMLKKQEKEQKQKEKEKGKLQQNVAKQRKMQSNQSQPSSTSAVNDPKMIANLNIMAQRNKKLSSLMAMVAKCEATMQQVEEFKKFIKIARDMPPPPDWNAGKQVAPPLQRYIAKPTKQTPPKSVSVPTKPQDNSVKSDATSNNKSADNEQKSSKIDVKPEVDSASTPLPNESSVENSNTPDVKIEEKHGPGRRRRSKPKDPAAEAEEKEMALTAFQQKYINDAELVFEYQEVIFVRFSIPKEAIIEHLEDTNDYIMSWMLVHNRKEIGRFKARRLKELTKNVADEDAKNKIIDDFNVYLERGCPVPLYTPMTVCLKGIHRKFVPIMMNSVKPIETVQALMKSVLEVGTRLSGYNLWYQLDAYEDKDLAENIRVALVDHENGIKGKRQRKQ